MKLIYTKSIILLSLFSVFQINTANAQFKDKFFISHGFSIYTDWVFGQKIASPNLYAGQGLYYDDLVLKATGASIFTYTPNFRYNLTEFDNNSSLSLNVPLGLGLMVSEFGFGSVEIPLFIAYNVGNISTYSADKNHGFTVGVGFEYFNMAVFKNSDYDLYPGALDGSSWVSPCVNIGYRYWNSKNIAREINFKLGFGSSSSTSITDINGTVYKVDQGSPLSVKLSWSRYMNY